MSIRNAAEAGFTHHRISTEKDGEEVFLHVVTAGDRKNPPIILLHGFPEYWGAWKKAMPALAAAGYYVVAPDQRGYGESTKPKGTKYYAVDRLVNDLFSLIAWTGSERCALVAHDWGGIVAWAAVQAKPERFRRFIAVNVPHPAVFGWALKNLPEQRRKSAYIGFFQIPALPEFYCRAFRFRALTKTLVKTSRPGTFSEEDLEGYREAWSRPHALHSMIEWYRAAKARKKSKTKSAKTNEKLQTPTLILWGARDAFFAKELAEKSRERCERARIDWFPEGTHWIHHEEPERVSGAILGFLSERDRFEEPRL
jgi:pimeloyl-ACP methyl ester carboxylesterase